ncbi:hypothetical protein ACFSX9_09090 [Flavobacterium ardleyense]|uniref:Lipoprotein n=1 Tax=Flavobacterium ardleyense TaxID=2038737 RepID=A0ABW5Z8U9_9FLAO
MFIALVIIGCQTEMKKTIQFDFSEKIQIIQNIQYPPKLFSSKEQLTNVLSQSNKPLYILKKDINCEKYDFEKYDYLFSFGKEVIKIQPTEDECDYLSKQPIKISNSKRNTGNYIFVYTVDKNKYRDLCP